MRTITMFWKEDRCAEVVYDETTRQVVSSWRDESRPVWLGFEHNGMTFQDIWNTCADRVLPECRFIRLPELQHEVGTAQYDPIKLCQYTHGALPTDNMWFRFSDDPKEYTWAEVSLRSKLT